MRKTILLTGLLIILFQPLTAQNFALRTYVEKTKVGVKSGTSLGVVNYYNWEYGVFYQESSLLESLMSDEQKANLPRNYEKQFYGLFFSAPVYESWYFTVKGQVRTGISNGENFVITPGVLAEYTPSDHLAFGVGIGSRAFRPTFQGSFSIIF